MKTIDIKGKEYVTVNERLKEFHKLYPEGSIKTEIMEREGDIVVFKATVYPAPNNLRTFTGWAYEKEGSSFINKTSYIENCETSAVGRALGMLGIGIDTAVASAEEVLNADKNYVEYIDEKQLSNIRDYVDNNAGFENRLLKHLKVESIDKITKQDYQKAIIAMEGAE